MSTTPKSKLQSWLQLIRLPNIFTIPGDILAGYAALTPFTEFNTAHFLYLTLASALLYCGGLILNDICDLKVDLLERPKRPLPSGAISIAQAYSAWIMMTISALVICWYLGKIPFIIAAIIVALVILYNGPARKLPKVAFIVMGLCRGFNLLLGASTAWQNAESIKIISPLFLTETLYILAVTYIAYNETKKLPAQIWCKMPLFICLAGINAIILLRPFDWFYLPFVLIFIWNTFSICESLQPTLPDKAIPPKIGELIRNLLLLQATFTIIADPAYYPFAIVLILLLPVAAKFSKKFYSS